MSRRKEISYEESTDACGMDEKNDALTYPFALVLRLRVAQIVCGISTLLMGAAALIEEKSQFNMGMGIPAGLSTVLAAANSIYCSRGFDGYQPSSCKNQPWAKMRFLGPTFRLASIHLILWGTASGLLVTLSFSAAKTVFSDETSLTIGILAAVEFFFSIIIIGAMLTIAWIDLHYDPD